MLSQKALLLSASRRPELRRLVTGTPATRRVVDRFHLRGPGHPMRRLAERPANLRFFLRSLVTTS